MSENSRNSKSISLQEKVNFLKQPENYPSRPDAVETVETHMAWVFLTDRHAWKLKNR